MVNIAAIQDLIPLLPLELQVQIRDRTIVSRSRDVIAVCRHILVETEVHYQLEEFPRLEYPWRTVLHLKCAPWTPVFYVYLWYLLNMYHMSIVFCFDAWSRWGGVWFDYHLFDKFWLHVFGEDWRVVGRGRSLMYPLHRESGRDAHLDPEFFIGIVKLNDFQFGGTILHNPATIEWVTNADGSYHRHDEMDFGYNSTCQTTIWRTIYLNTGQEYNPDELASSPDVYNNIQHLLPP